MKYSNTMLNSQSKSLWKRIKARWQLYLLLVVPIVYIIIFAYVPMGGLIIAFKNYKLTKGIWGSDWVGFANFQKLFSSYKFGLIIKNTLLLSLYGFIAGFPLPIIFALMLNAFPGKRYNKLVQTVTYIPHFISTVVMVGIVFQLLDYRTGIYGSLYTLFSGSTAPNLLAQGNLFKHIYVWSGIWQSTGYSAIIYIAALASVDQNLHEAARIDGASHFQRVRYIDLPSILPTISIMLILSIGGIMNVGFEKILLMQNSLNLNDSEVISTYVYKIGLASGVNNFSLSTAIGMFNSVINFILLIVSNFISKKISGSGIF